MIELRKTHEVRHWIVSRALIGLVLSLLITAGEIALRRISLIGRLLPAPQTVQWGVSAVYHVAFHIAPGAACGAQRCHQVDLLDAGQPTGRGGEAAVACGLVF